MAANVIELNGKRYDAITGAYLGEGKGKPYIPPSQHQNRGKHLDGFIRATGKQTDKQSPRQPSVVKPTTKVYADIVPANLRKTPSTTRPAARSRRSEHKSVAATDVHQKVTRKSPAANRPLPAASKAHPMDERVAQAVKTGAAEHRVSVITKPHQPQHTKTLMRRVVHKPHTTMKPAIRTQALAGTTPPEAASLLFKPSVSRVDEARLKRAKAIAKYSGIRHFMPVKPDYTPDALTTTPQRSLDSVPVIAVRPVPAHAHGKPVHTRTHNDIFEAAIAHANSHTQPRHKAVRRRSNRFVNTLAAVAALLVLGGFVTYLNMPNIELHVASIQAGFKADIPDYKPTGYALNGGVQRHGNTVSLRFISGENQYTITQQPSAWNSQTLQENTLALADSTHKTVKAGGRTVFIYNGSNAVWVNGGVRYDLTTNAPLSTDDITRLATSL